ncbi:helix-turn-helix domain-containing protein [Nitratireductor mangrovi]|uniref:Helix-turn-helix domain-containing protein n=1 Tax=Nitratireductor mangrovi TaxID=2599600 RepID=A0A5B8KX14_9HYPH|nr:helix-turn-helix domain-containing protein [Nitratireductor mangrovi]QDZ00116.1 helix-turn-helix domain-containing protein [Nitratireductor mangrovi]
MKLHRSYTVDEAARATGASKGTVRRWLRNGLPAITDQRPLLIIGEDLIAFLGRQKRQRQQCKLHECYCFSCRRPRSPAFGEAEFFPLSASSGNLRALCETCTTIMHKRLAVSKLDELGAILDVTIQQADQHLSEMPKPCPNDHFAKEG